MPFVWHDCPREPMFTCNCSTQYMILFGHFHYPYLGLVQHRVLWLHGAKTCTKHSLGMRNHTWIRTRVQHHSQIHSNRHTVSVMLDDRPTTMEQESYLVTAHFELSRKGRLNILTHTICNQRHTLATSNDVFLCVGRCT